MDRFKHTRVWPTFRMSQDIYLYSLLPLLTLQSNGFYRCALVYLFLPAALALSCTLLTWFSALCFTLCLCTLIELSIWKIQILSTRWIETKEERTCFFPFLPPFPPFLIRVIWTGKPTQTSHPSASLCCQTAGLLVVRISKSRMGGRIFSFQLPVWVLETGTLTTFKIRLKHFLFDKTYSQGWIV